MINDMATTVNHSKGILILLIDELNKLFEAKKIRFDIEKSKIRRTI